MLTKMLLQTFEEARNGPPPRRIRCGRWPILPHWTDRDKEDLPVALVEVADSINRVKEKTDAPAPYLKLATQQKASS